MVMFTNFGSISRNLGDTFLVPGTKKVFPKFRKIEKTLVKITLRVRRSRLLFQS